MSSLKAGKEGDRAKARAVQLLALLCPTRPAHAVGVSRCPWPHPPAEVEEPLGDCIVPKV